MRRFLLIVALLATAVGCGGAVPAGYRADGDHRPSIDVRIHRSSASIVAFTPDEPFPAEDFERAVHAVRPGEARLSDPTPCVPVSAEEGTGDAGPTDADPDDPAPLVQNAYLAPPRPAVRIRYALDLEAIVDLVRDRPRAEVWLHLPTSVRSRARIDGVATTASRIPIALDNRPHPPIEITLGYTTSEALAGTLPVVVFGATFLLLGLGYYAVAIRRPTRNPTWNPTWAWRRLGYARRILQIAPWIAWPFFLLYSGLASLGWWIQEQASIAWWAAVLLFLLLPVLLVTSVALLPLAALTRRAFGVRTGFLQVAGDNLADHAYVTAILIAGPIAIWLSFIPEAGGQALAAAATTVALLVLAWCLRARSDAGYLPTCETPLRDRILTAARSVRPAIRSVRVAPTARPDSARAARRRRRTILLTDDVLEALDEQELEAVIRHDLSIPRRFAWARLGSPLVFIVTLVSLYFAGGSWLDSAPSSDEPAAVGIAILVVIPLLVARWTETALARWLSRRADRHALRACRDPEALISAIVKLADLCHVSWDRGPIGKLHATEPTPRARTRTIFNRSRSSRTAHA